VGSLSILRIVGVPDWVPTARASVQSAAGPSGGRAGQNRTDRERSWHDGNGFPGQPILGGAMAVGGI